MESTTFISNTYKNLFNKKKIGNRKQTYTRRDYVYYSLPFLRAICGSLMKRLSLDQVKIQIKRNFNRKEKELPYVVIVSRI